MSDLRVAKRYAKALMDFSIEKKILDKVFADMTLIFNTCEENRDLTLALRSPIIKFDKKRAILQAIFKGKVNNATLGFLDIVCRKNRSEILPSIASEFTYEYKEYNGIVTAVVTTSSKISAGTRKELTAMVKNIVGNKEIELEEKIDEELIGGYILKVGDQQINDSISGKLKTLRLGLVESKFEKKI